MPTEPQIEILSVKKRKAFFVLLVVVFVLLLPAMIFYTTGYRLDFTNDEQTVVTTGGMYVTAEADEVDVYLDTTLVNNRLRIFRSAYYIQDISAGQHRVVVQRPDLVTWVKELPIDPHIVIEASAFNMPVVPHVRPITEYVTTTGEAIYLGVASTSEMFVKATSTTPVIFSERLSPATLTINQEYDYVVSLFATTSSSTRSVFESFLDEVDRFRFATTTSLVPVASNTVSYVERGDMRIAERETDLYAVWLGSVDRIPYYFCVTEGTASSSIAARYGEHVAVQIEELKTSTTTPLIVDGNRVCRPEIKLNRLRQDVYFYDFFPNTSHLVLLQLEDGLYVTEIDDRAWQNVQLLYPGRDLQVVVENNTIYVHDGEYYFEVITQIEPS